MFIRKIKSRNSICFQIGKKEGARFKLIKHIGCSTSIEEIEALRLKANQALKEMRFNNQLTLFPDGASPPKAKLLSWRITGYHHTLGRVYDSIGFPASLLKDLVIARIVYPKSKAATVRYLSCYLGIKVDLDRVYRFLDAMDKDKLTDIAFKFVSRKNNGICLFFYDVTTLHFESETEDSLRQKGFSKNHRGDMPQVLIGLFVDHEGYPFDFYVFEGNTFEGHTFQKAMNTVTAKHTFTALTVVADAGMLSEENLKFLDRHNFNYIVGARLKNMDDEITEKITAHNYLKESVWETQFDSQRLIVEYSSSRAKKDVSERKKTIEKLLHRLEERREVVRKSKYLIFEEGGKAMGINQTKVQKDTLFDGLKGYITNSSNMTQALEVIGEYRNLWKVEKAFRMSKSDLKERPVFHQNVKRIKSHLLLCFVALLVAKETETILSPQGYSLQATIEILGKAGEGEARVGNVKLLIDSELSEEAQVILKLFKGY